jgi:hypothetical protein
MIFVRTRSHNLDESIELSDFLPDTLWLARMLPST